MQRYTVEVKETATLTFVIEAATPEEAMQKAHTYPYWQVERIERQHLSTQVQLDAEAWSLAWSNL
ncbi:MAG: hypothetical protein KC425_14595 [Anaerolineales bacterium]|nr:hypothetical protein [Anaerolineales bacterium]